MNKLVIIGAGGHGRVVADCAQTLGAYQEIVFLDACFEHRKINAQWPIVGVVENWVDYTEDADFIVAFGNNNLRMNILNDLIKNKANITTIIHPNAVVSANCHIDIGSVVFANAVINIGSSIGKGCIINTGATVDHDCSLNDGIHISPGANIAGGVTIGSLSWLGIGSSVIECLTLASNTLIGAGAAVTSSTEPDSLYVGVPAKKIKTLE